MKKKERKPQFSPVYFTEYVLCLFAAKIFSLLPFSWSTGIAKRIGDVAYCLMPGRRQIALANLDQAFGDSLGPAAKQKIARESFQDSALSILELFLIEKTKGQLGRRFKVYGLAHAEQAFAKGRGVIVAASHLGSWEYLSFLASFYSGHWSFIVKGVKNSYLDRKISALRCATRAIPIHKKNSMKTVVRELRQNHGVGIPIDQWAGPEGLWQNFFGRPTSTTSLPARLAKRMGCVLLPACCLRKPGGNYEIQIEPGIDVEAAGAGEEEITAQLNQWLESWIRKYPEQWLWPHRRWKPKPVVSAS